MAKADFDKEKIRRLAKEIDRKNIIVSLQFTSLLIKTLDFPEFLTIENVNSMLKDLKNRFTNDEKNGTCLEISVGEIIRNVNSMKEELRKKTLIL